MLTPARRATALVVSAPMPSSSTSAAAAAQIASTVSRDRSWVGVRRRPAGVSSTSPLLRGAPTENSSFCYYSDRTPHVPHGLGGEPPRHRGRLTPSGPRSVGAGEEL